MNIQTLKYELIEWVTQTNDDALLKALKNIKDANISSGTWIEELSPQETESIKRGLADHEKGDVLTSQEFWASHESKI
ncbi:hypothetical protein [Rufibacter sp. LB8]|uniref:hypothetical protein n=1 Tax=Rufibacter sp. LB8 TaxID=2777781 RepID=UPI00178C3078|nr:hypothetical protein [Rufibacter sp. LB8]